MGIGSKISLVADVIRSVNSGKNSLEEVIEDLVKQPLVLGSDIESIVPLARKFAFIEGEDDDLCITKQGLEFMKYVDGTSRETSELGSPMEEDYVTLDKVIRDVGAKYEKENKDDIQSDSEMEDV